MIRYVFFFCTALLLGFPPNGIAQNSVFDYDYTESGKKGFLKTLFGVKRVNYKLSTKLQELDPRLIPYLRKASSSKGFLDIDVSAVREAGLGSLLSVIHGKSAEELYFDYKSPKMTPKLKAKLREMAPSVFKKSLLSASGDYDLEIVRVSDFEQSKSSCDRYLDTVR